MEEEVAEVKLEVPHVKQKLSWDCGLACTQMILLHFGKPFKDIFNDVCAEINFGNSVWTIDIAYILHHFQVKFYYTTITLGVDQGYSSKSFYREKFTGDELRVTDMFEKAHGKNIKVEKRSVSLDSIIDHLSKKNMLIALVDWNHLKCQWCDTKCLPTFSCMGRCLGAYQGHYIVVCGFHRKRSLIYYKNPSYSKELCCCTYETFEAARTCYGTDEDLIFIESNVNSDLPPDNEANHADIKSGNNATLQAAGVEESTSLLQKTDDETGVDH